MMKVYFVFDFMDYTEMFKQIHIQTKNLILSYNL